MTYNDWPLIQHCVESAKWVDEIVAVDGRYPDFPQLNESDYSTDGTLEYLESLSKAVIIRAAGLYEVEKRNQYLVGKEGDWYLHLDADEVWVGGRPDIDNSVDAYVVKEWRKKVTPVMDRVRLFRHVDGLHYEKKHYWLQDGDGKTFAILARAGNGYRAGELKTCHIIHREEERPVERKSAKKRYYRELTRRESRIKETL